DEDEADDARDHATDEERQDALARRSLRHVHCRPATTDEHRRADDEPDDARDVEPEEGPDDACPNRNQPRHRSRHRTRFRIAHAPLLVCESARENGRAAATFPPISNRPGRRYCHKSMLGWRTMYMTARVVENRPLARGNFVLRLSLPDDGEALRGALPGQFVMLRGEWGRDPLLPRAFSILRLCEGGC